MAVLKSRGEWPVDNQEVRMKKGKLVRVEIRPGQFVKMYEVDARERGLDFEDPKAKPPAPDKMRRPSRDKSQEPEKKPESQPEKAIEPGEDEPPMIDFQTIPGVGKGSAQALHAHGIHTFEELAAAEDLDFLQPQVLEAIAEWKLTPVEPDEEDGDPEEQAE